MQTNSKGRLDYVYYAYEIYNKLLFPYIHELHALNPHKTIVVVKDNVGLYHRARLLMASQI